MGIVKISEQLHESLRVASNALSRSINAQAEHWMRMGMLAELHPDLNHRELCQLLVRMELAGGFDIESLVAEPVPPHARTGQKSGSKDSKGSGARKH